MHLSTSEPRVIIIGAGYALADLRSVVDANVYCRLGGLSFAVALKQKLGFTNFIVSI
jgi:hypothetical protein